MRKKLFTTICAFSTLSILCVTPVMAKTTSVNNTRTQSNVSKVFSIYNSQSCGELMQNTNSLCIKGNAGISDVLTNLLQNGCNLKAEKNGAVTGANSYLNNTLICQPTDISKPNGTATPNSTPCQNPTAAPTETNAPNQTTTAAPDSTSSPAPTITATPQVTSTPVVSNTETPQNKDFVSQVAQLVNAERAKAGLSPVTLDTTLSKAAQVRAKETVSYFSHTRLNGSTFSSAITEQGISFRGAGENIAYGQKTPQEVMNGWMNSAGHRANILNVNFTKIGVGYYQQNGVNYWTQLFTY